MKFLVGRYHGHGQFSSVCCAKSFSRLYWICASRRFKIAFSYESRGLVVPRKHYKTFLNWSQFYFTSPGYPTRQRAIIHGKTTLSILKRPKILEDAKSTKSFYNLLSVFVATAQWRFLRFLHSKYSFVKLSTDSSAVRIFAGILPCIMETNELKIWLRDWMQWICIWSATTIRLVSTP